MLKGKREVWGRNAGFKYLFASVRRCEKEGV